MLTRYYCTFIIIQHVHPRIFSPFGTYGWIFNYMTDTMRQIFYIKILSYIPTFIM